MSDLKPGAIYTVTHDGVGGAFVKGDKVYPGTFDDEQLVRLIDLGAIEVDEDSTDDWNLAQRPDPQTPSGRGESTGNRVVDQALGLPEQQSGPTDEVEKQRADQQAKYLQEQADEEERVRAEAKAKADEEERAKKAAADKGKK